jgi:hypothetical protein
MSYLHRGNPHGERGRLKVRPLAWVKVLRGCQVSAGPCSEVDRCGATVLQRRSSRGGPKPMSRDAVQQHPARLRPGRPWRSANCLAADGARGRWAWCGEASRWSLGTLTTGSWRRPRRCRAARHDGELVLLLLEQVPGPWREPLQGLAAMDAGCDTDLVTAAPTLTSLADADSSHSRMYIVTVTAARDGSITRHPAQIPPICCFKSAD